ncbi:uncharacterized protein LOC116213307 isoform X2 [Punica granatum]|uniref:Uncharacterized protein LOC116213307 isoform X2 n=1 Tax=Punica granatum TaxID=22663 RepID=A0A6P8E9X3_PUNGR|nr:uncharacterized protein LOC116213307 isoform X2 [Punica granatum]
MYKRYICECRVATEFNCTRRFIKVKNGWAAEGARERYESMVSLQRNVADGEEGMTEAEISQLYLAADQVTCLDFGRGTKPHPRSKNCCSDAHSTAQLQAKLEEQQEKFDAQQKQIDWLQKIVEKLMGDQADFGDYSTSSAHN